MSLDGVLRRRLFYHSSVKFVGTFKPHLTISQRDLNRSLEKCFIHSTLMFPSGRVGIRLLSVSLHRFGVLSQLTSYFTSKSLKKDHLVKEELNHHNSNCESPVDGKQVKDSSRKHNWKSIIDKFTVTLPGVWTALPISVTPAENSSVQNSLKRKLDFQKEIVESTEKFLKQYNSDLDFILKRVSPPPAVKRSKLKKQKLCTESENEKADIFKNIKYPMENVKKSEAVKMPRFEETQQFLHSLGIPVNELEYYPEVQEMDETTIRTCVSKLKDLGIHVIFSLFLIKCISKELNIQRKESGTRKKVRLMSMEAVQIYMELCQNLDKPDLDIRHLLEQLAYTRQYPTLYTLNWRIKKLRAIGATPDDILSNLEILKGHEFFDEKIELFQKSPFLGQRPFPVHLFLAKTMASFTEQLAISDGVQKIAKLLDVTITDFQTCWGFRYHISSSLLFKVHMCLSVGISKKDIFSNLGALNWLPVDQCHAVTSCFRNSGLPASMFVLHKMVNTAKLNGDLNVNSNSMHNISSNSKCVESVDATYEEDWTGEARTVRPGAFRFPPKANKISTIRNGILSTKTQRKKIFTFISHLLKLDRAMASAMYDCHFSIGATDVLDVSRNLDYLLSFQFTKEQIALCPLILVHSHAELSRVVTKAEDIVLTQLHSASASFGSLLSSSSSSSAYATSTHMREDDKHLVAELLQKNPVVHLNTLQYLLEKENSFGLAFSG